MTGRGETRDATSEIGGVEAFFLAGVGGDEPEFDDLRSRLTPHLHLVPATYPDAGARGAVLSNMIATAEVVVADIAARQAAGPIALVGYSFGGSLALEVAAQLAHAGRLVDFLCVLDAPFRMEELRGLFEVLRLATAPRRAVKKVVEAATLSETTLRFVSSAAPAVMGLNRAEPVKRALLTHLRGKALDNWVPPTSDAAGLLISTGTLGAANRDRWLKQCPNLACVTVDGEHERLLMGDALDQVAEALVAATRRVIAARV